MQEMLRSTPSVHETDPALVTSVVRVCTPNNKVVETGRSLVSPARQPSLISKLQDPMRDETLSQKIKGGCLLRNHTERCPLDLTDSCTHVRAHTNIHGHTHKLNFYSVKTVKGKSVNRKFLCRSCRLTGVRRSHCQCV